jgi:DNA replication protein DnaC
MNSDQKKAYNVSIAGSNVLLTGSGGVGKSYVLSKILEKFCKQKKIF